MLRWSKECKGCGRRYPSACGIAACLQCRTELERTQKEPTVDEEEFKNLSYVYGRTIPGSLSTEEQEKCDAEWEALEAEAAKRGSRWSVSDLIGDGFAVRQAA